MNLSSEPRGGSNAAFEKVRLDATVNTPLIALARSGADAFGYAATLKIDSSLAQLLRLRVAQINNCAYCLSVHHAAAEDVNIPAMKVNMLTAWWETGLFSGAERAALAYAEHLTRVADAKSDAPFQTVHDDLAVHFDHEQILEIVGVVINMNIWTRLKLAEGATPRV